MIERFSFRRTFVLVFFLMIFALAVRQSAFIDPDLWWHLQTGEDIVTSQTIPQTDIYSFTKAGSEWVTHEWLSEVFIYETFRTAGWAGLLIVFSTLITFAFYLTYRRCVGKPYIGALAILLAVAAASPTLGVRPQMITLLFASIFVSLLTQYSNDGQIRRLYWLAPMMLLWVNFHAGYALGLGLIVLYAITLLLDRKWTLIPRLAAVGVACIAMVPLNPNGFRMFSYPLETLRSPSMAAFIEEWASPDFHKAMFLPLALFLFLLLGALALSPKRARLSEVFLVFVTGLAALRSARHIPIFVLIAAPIFAQQVWELIRARAWDARLMAPQSSTSRTAVVFALLLLLAPAVLDVALVGHFVANQAAYEAKNYPRAAVDFIDSAKVPGPIYNRYGWGGYLIRRLHGEYPVYIDGRADVYGDKFMYETFNTYEGGAGWFEPLDRLAIRTVLISPDVPLASLLRSDDQWQKVYEDNQAVIFTRSRVPETFSARNQ
ncbi:MAG TPA: hypothetical protein VJ875_14510 [Pyrinomonadaceae bacterium]|nr:hypothetical protein [Pyrinomonadaceae bacterium]